MGRSTHAFIDLSICRKPTLCWQHIKARRAQRLSHQYSRNTKAACRWSSALQKPGATSAVRRELSYFVGSGAVARSYLTAVDGFLYEAPATYYSRIGKWAPSPGYDRYSYPFLTRAIAPACLGCHASGVQAIAGTQNGYQSPPFLEGGVSCERCHGPGAQHASNGKPQDIINPVKLAPEQRDSVCAQCHLSGEIRVDRAEKSMSNFTAGSKLSDFTTTFVRATATAEIGRASCRERVSLVV